MLDFITVCIEVDVEVFIALTNDHGYNFESNNYSYIDMNNFIKVTRVKMVKVT